MDIGVTLDVALSVPTGADHRGGVDPNTFKCHLCSKHNKKEKMRHHISWHILRAAPESGLPCGFCGRKDMYAIPQYKHSQTASDCMYYVKFNKPKKSTTYAPSTNSIMNYDMHCLPPTALEVQHGSALFAQPCRA